MFGVNPHTSPPSLSLAIVMQRVKISAAAEVDTPGEERQKTETASYYLYHYPILSRRCPFD